MVAMVEVILLVALAFLGRMAGGWTGGWWCKSASPLIGAAIGYLVAGAGWHLLAASVAGWLGEKPGVGWPRGYIEHGVSPGEIDGRAAPERWQPASTVQRPYLALALRGAIWGLPFLPLAWWAPGYLVVPLAYAAAMPAAAWLSQWMPRWKACEKPARRWAWSEFLQQPMAGVLLIAL